MTWLYGQTWLWYLLAFVVGVLLSRLLPGRRPAAEPAGHPPVTGLAAAVSAATVADAGTPVEPAPARAADPALNTIDTAAFPAVPGSATAGLGAAGVGPAPSPDEADVTDDGAPERGRRP